MTEFKELIFCHLHRRMQMQNQRVIFNWDNYFSHMYFGGSALFVYLLTLIVRHIQHQYLAEIIYPQAGATTGNKTFEGRSPPLCTVKVMTIQSYLADKSI